MAHTRHIPKLTIDLEGITTHLDALAGTDLCPHCEAAVTTLAATSRTCSLKSIGFTARCSKRVSSPRTVLQLSVPL